jgi:hypothetical protein
MPDALLARFPDGLRRPAVLEVSGESPWVKPRIDDSEPTFTSFSVDWLDTDGNVVFHFNPRPETRRVALNALVDGRWGKEQSVRRYPFPLEAGVPFALRFEVDERAFNVSVDGRRLGRFKHRRPPSTIAEVRSTAFLWRLEETADGLGSRGRAHLPEFVPTFRPDAARTWVAAEPNPPDPRPLGSFRLFAILCTWMEEDVIEATVANCLRQGCERVYLIDNGSPDATVERATAAGATLAEIYDEGYFEDLEKTRRLQRVVDEVSAAGDSDHVWWLFLDADEFYHGPDGLTLREYLARLDRRFRIVHARCFNHMPSGEPGYVEGRHPLDFQPLCHELRGVWCERGHWRHSLQRWDRDAPPIRCGFGFHDASSSERLLEPAEPVLYHHFPYRAEEATRRRLTELFGRRAGAENRLTSRAMALHMRLRLRSLDAVYRQQWDEVAFYPPCSPGYVPLKPWEEWVPPESREILRWYG